MSEGNRISKIMLRNSLICDHGKKYVLLAAGYPTLYEMHLLTVL